MIEIDGHDMEQILGALSEAKETKGKPTFIVANTVKGKGVSFMENVPKWHSSGLSDEEYEVAMKELTKKEEELAHAV